MKSRKFLPITGQGAQGRDVHSTEQVYAFIRDYIGQNNFAPSVRDIAQGCYLSVSAVLRHLDKLEAWGYITREPGVARSISLTHREETT